ncbi:MAG: hypothetical protein WDZ96_03340 [Acidimicrobiia bacterium]
MIGLLKAEITKLTGRKLYPVMILIIVIFTGLTGFFLMIFRQIFPGAASEGLPLIEKPDAYFLGIQQVVGQTWFPLILAVVVLGGELASTIWATSLTRESRKTSQIAARLLVFTVASWFAMLIGVAVWSVMAAWFAEGSGGPSTGDWMEVLWKVGVSQLAWVSLGIGFVALLRSVGPAIGAVIALSFGEGLLVLWRPYQNISLTGATTGIFGSFGLDGIASMFLPAPVSTLHALAIMVGWTGLGLLLTWWGLNRRDA